MTIDVYVVLINFVKVSVINLAMNKLFVSLIILVFCFESKAQYQYSLSFAEGDIIAVDTSEFNSLIPLEFFLINTGTDTIFWNIPIYYSVNADATYSDDLTPVSNLFNVVFSDNTPFAPGDSFYFNSEESDISLDGLYINVTNERNFKAGDNIIIVWPAFSTDNMDNVVFNSTQYIKEIYVPHPLSVQSKKDIDFRIFNDRQSLRIESLKTFDEVYIYSINGKLIHKGRKNHIPTHHLSKGIYLLKIRFNDGDLQRGRVFISND